MGLGSEIMYNFSMKKKVLAKEDIIHLAKLANLKLTDAEIEKYLKQLEETVEYVENLNELDTDKVEPTNSVMDLKNVTYEDGRVSKNSLTSEEALSNAKNKKDNYFKVDRIM